MTAIAAVLASLSTPLLAQTAEAPADAPVVAPPAPMTAAPVAPAAAQATSPAVAAPAATGLNIPRISINMDDAPQADATASPPVARAARNVEAPKVAASQPAATTTPVTRATAPTPPEAVAPAVTEAAPVPMAAEEPAAVPPPPLAKAAPAMPATGDDDTLPIAGAAGLGVLALAGGAFALLRRRKRDAFDGEPAYDQPVAARDEMLLTDPAPAAVTAPMRTPIGHDAPAAAMPAGFDISRYGRHVQAAYRGPTPENPSLSLRNRLRRARFFDQRERQAGTILASQAEERVETATPRSAPAVTPRRSDLVTTRPANWRKPDFRPAFQS